MDRLDLIALDSLIENYDYEADPVLQGPWRPIERKLLERIRTFGRGVNDYGLQIEAHLKRTSEDGDNFLTHVLGFSQAAGRNFFYANLLQDLGKTHDAYDPLLWTLPHRPSKEERLEKKKHVPRGPEVLKDALAGAPSEVKNHPHVATVIPAIMLFHHERADGGGPYGKTSEDMGLVIKTVCIVDAKDGDTIPRPHQPSARTEAEALARMADPTGKYGGAFDDLLKAYIAHAGARAERGG